MFANKELKAKVVWDSNKGSTWYFSKLAKSITTLCWKILPVSSVLQRPYFGCASSGELWGIWQEAQTFQNLLAYAQPKWWKKVILNKKKVTSDVEQLKKQKVIFSDFLIKDRRSRRASKNQKRIQIPARHKWFKAVEERNKPSSSPWGGGGGLCCSQPVGVKVLVFERF